jgi:hypothetical protein
MGIRAAEQALHAATQLDDRQLAGASAAILALLLRAPRDRLARVIPRHGESAPEGVHR